MKVYGNTMNLKIARIKNGLFQSEVATEIGISENAYSQIERGIKSTSCKTAAAICKCLGVCFDDVFTLKQEV